MPLELVVKVEYFPASGAVPLPRVPSGKAPALWRPILDVGPLCSGADLPWFLLLQLFQWLAAAETARGLAKSAPRTCCGFIRQPEAEERDLNTRMQPAFSKVRAVASSRPPPSCSGALQRRGSPPRRVSWCSDLLTARQAGRRTRGAGRRRRARQRQSCRSSGGCRKLDTNFNNSFCAALQVLSASYLTGAALGLPSALFSSVFPETRAVRLRNAAGQDWEGKVSVRLNREGER